MHLIKYMNQLKKNELSPQNIKFQTSEWLKTFLLVYQKSNVTPYMHIFVSHLHEFVYLYGEINLFTEPKVITAGNPEL